jgi:hypothetical protein
MENTMTDLHSTPEFWDDIKVNYIARAKDIAALGSDELEALQALRWSCLNLSQSVEYFVDFEYTELVKFVKASTNLCESFGWDQSSSEEKRHISKASEKISKSIQLKCGLISLEEAMEFSTLSEVIQRYFRCSPTKYQVRRFEEFGITWEGKVCDH